jgi:hypothetical protein
MVVVIGCNTNVNRSGRDRWRSGGGVFSCSTTTLSKQHEWRTTHCGKFVAYRYMRLCRTLLSTQQSIGTTNEYRIGSTFLKFEYFVLVPCIIQLFSLTDFFTLVFSSFGFYHFVYRNALYHLFIVLDNMYVVVPIGTFPWQQSLCRLSIYPGTLYIQVSLRFYHGVYLYQDTSSNSDKPLDCNCRYCLLHGWSVLSTSFFCNKKYINKCPKYHVKKWLFLQRWPQRSRARLTILTNFVTFTTRLEMKQV